MSIDTDEFIIGTLREQLFTPKVNTIFTDAAEVAARERYEMVHPVLLDELTEPKVKCYTRPRKRAQLNGKHAWLALPVGIADYVRQRAGKLRNAARVIGGLIFFAGLAVVTAII